MNTSVSHNVLCTHRLQVLALVEYIGTDVIGHHFEELESKKASTGFQHLQRLVSLDE